MRVCRLFCRRALLIVLCLPLLAQAGLFDEFDPTVPPTPLQYGIAVETGNASKVTQWLEAGLSADFMADRIGSGLMIAAWNGNLGMIRLFLDHGAHVDLVNAYHEQALQLAAWRGHLEAVKLLIERGARINRDGDEWSALHYATFAGHENVARLLIEKGANVNARTPNESTPLMLAAREGRTDLARQLLEAGADSSAVNEFGDSALAFAMRNKNYGIAKMVSRPEDFARAARRPEAFGEAEKSIPVTDEMRDLIGQMNQALAEGKPVDEIRKKLYDVLARYRQEETARGARQPGAAKALVITADRNKKGAEEARLRFGSDKASAKNKASDKASAKKPAAAKPAPARAQPRQDPAKKSSAGR